MSDTAVGASAPKLDDLMLAMDVVDTLRHDQRLVERELSVDASDEALIKRLREVYKGQGIEVPDRVLEEGVKALKEKRFSYEPPRPSLARSLALLWIGRARGLARSCLVLSFPSLPLGPPMIFLSGGRND
jgi:Family of unknown function (DUF6384)